MRGRGRLESDRSNLDLKWEEDKEQMFYDLVAEEVVRGGHSGIRNPPDDLRVQVMIHP